MPKKVSKGLKGRGGGKGGKGGKGSKLQGHRTKPTKKVAKPAKPANDAKRGRAESSKPDDSSTKRQRVQVELRDPKVAKRAQRKTFGELVDEAKKIWEELRKTELTSEEREPMMAKMFELLGNKLQQVVLRHDASRVVQTMLKYGSPEQREQIAEALVPVALDLARSHYGKYLLMKLLRYGVKRVRQDVIKAFRGNMSRLLTNKESAHVLEFLFHELSGRARALFIRELYGPAFTVYFNPAKGSLLSSAASSSSTSKSAKVTSAASSSSSSSSSAASSSASTDAKPAEEQQVNMVEIISSDSSLKRATVQHLEKMMGRTLHKGPPIVEFSLLHKMMRDYFLLLDDKQRQEFSADLRELVVHILHTRDGAWLGAQAVRYSTPKDRKVLVRQLKGYVGRAASEEHGHVVIMACLNFVDDTVLLSKNIVKALVDPTSSMALPSTDDPDDLSAARPKNPLLHYIQDKYARLAILQILSPSNPKYLNPRDLELMKPCFIREPVKKSAVADDGDDDEDGDSKKGQAVDEAEEKKEEQGRPTSRKSPEDRKRELLASLQEPLLATLTENAKELACSDTGFAVLLEALGTFPEAKHTGAIVAQLVDNAKEIACHPHGNRILKKLLRWKDYPQRVQLVAGLIEKLGAEQDIAELAKHEYACWVIVGLLTNPEDAQLAKFRTALLAAKAKEEWPKTAGTDAIVQLLPSAPAKSAKSTPALAATKSTPSKSATKSTPSKSASKSTPAKASAADAKSSKSSKRR